MCGVHGRNARRIADDGRHIVRIAVAVRRRVRRVREAFPVVKGGSTPSWPRFWVATEASKLCLVKFRSLVGCWPVLTTTATCTRVPTTRMPTTSSSTRRRRVAVIFADFYFSSKYYCYRIYRSSLENKSPHAEHASRSRILFSKIVVVLQARPDSTLYHIMKIT